MSLNMICLDLNLRALSIWGHQRRLGDDPGYLVHAATRKIFGELGPQPFLVQSEQSRVLGYTPADEAFLRQCLENFRSDEGSDSLLPAVFNLPEICSRVMPEQWSKGSRYRFSVYCRPTIRRGKVESDVWLMKNYFACEEAKKNGTFDGTIHEFRQLHKGEIEETYRQWLQRRFAPAAELRNVVITGSRSSYLTTRSAKDHRGAPTHSERRSYPETMFVGELCVTESQAFERLVRHGVGRHCAFGFGMLLLKAVQ